MVVQKTLTFASLHNLIMTSEEGRWHFEVLGLEAELGLTVAEVNALLIKIIAG